MRVYTTLTRNELSAIAQACDVCIDTGGNTQPSEGTVMQRGRNKGKTRYTFVLRPVAQKDSEGNRPWQRISASWGQNERRVFAVCWHGHATFMRTLYACDPDARIESGIATYANADDFEANYRRTASRQIGAPIMPIVMAEACVCEYQCTDYSDVKVVA